MPGALHAVSGVAPFAPPTRAEAWALAYLALPSAIFLAGWIVLPIGPVAGVLVMLAGLSPLALREAGDPRRLGPLVVPVLAVAALWCVLAGVGHLVFANPDWVVRDGVLVDLVGRSWPVTYDIDGVATLMRAPIGYFLPAALVGKVWGIHAAQYALLAWTVCGVALVFMIMLHDRPPLKVASIRIAVFIVFSGMDIVGEILHHKPYAIGQHLEWWAYLFQYSSSTTQLFWVPNHALPGWIAMAWLLAQDRRRASLPIAILFVVFTPLWSPLTAIGTAPIVGALLLRRAIVDGAVPFLRQIADWRMVAAVVVCGALVFPYLVAGSAQVASGSSASVRWVGDDIVPRTIEFVLFEFVGFALVLLRRDRRDWLSWAAVVVLLSLPLYRFGPYNDLAMRASIPPLALLAIRLGAWLSTPWVRREQGARVIAIALLGIGAVTPFMEVARVFLLPRWDLAEHASLPDVTRGTHYLTPVDRSWKQQFLRLPDRR